MNEETDNQFNVTLPTLFVAAGKGARLGKLGRATPKCMFRIPSKLSHGKPILEHLIQLFKNADSTIFFCVVGHQAHVITDFFGDGSRFGVKITSLRQGPGKGNAYAVQAASASLKGHHFFYCDADILFLQELPILLRDRFTDVQCDAVISFGKDPSIARTHKSAQSFSQALTKCSIQLGVHLTEYILMGINILGPAVLPAFTDELPPPPNMEEISVSQILQENASAMYCEYAFYDGPWWHLAYPEDFVKLEPKLADLKLTTCEHPSNTS